MSEPVNTLNLFAYVNYLERHLCLCCIFTTILCGSKVVYASIVLPIKEETQTPLKESNEENLYNIQFNLRQLNVRVML